MTNPAQLAPPVTPKVKASLGATGLSYVDEKADYCHVLQFGVGCLDELQLCFSVQLLK